MKKLVLFLLLASPLLALAQVNDMYFVPKKEKKVLVVKSAEEIYLVDDVENVDNGGEYTDEYVDEAETAYFTNDLYDVMDDYTYSTRIVRFQSPSRLLSTNLYWDLKYSCGINDWLVYDNGYTVYIYPTANNIFYNDPYYYNRVNLWNWNTYHTWYYPYYRHNYWWDCYDYHWAHHNHYWHKPYYGYHGSHNLSWKPANRKSNIPTNGSIAGKPHRDQPVRTVTNGNNPRREQQVRTTANGHNPRRDNPRREQQVRTTANGNNPRREQQARTTANGNNPRREQQVRTTANRQQQSRTSVNNSNVKRSSSSSSSSGRRVERGGSRSSGNSSGGYSRPSSTGVSRSSGSSSSGGSRGGGSSYSSGGGGSRGGSNRSSGGHSGGGGRSSGTRR